MKTEQIIEIARRTIKTEASSIEALSDFIDNSFASVIDLIYRSKGRVIVTGIGKSANIANKIVATLNSTGTPAVFIHAADAIHGDLGMVQKEDVVIALSKSGDTPEIKVLVPLIKNMGNALVALTGNPDSYLGTRADFVLNSFVQQEACPNNLGPTTSTTAQLVIGDAVAICLLEMRNFTSHDFAQYHPGGSLGKRLYLTVGDLYTQNERPVVQIDAGMKTIIMEISARRLGMTAVEDGDALCGIITDGDLRRMLEREVNIQTITAREIMTPNPKTIPSDMLAAEALEIMEKMNITQLLVVDEGVYKGVVHLHDIIKEGIL